MPRQKPKTKPKILFFSWPSVAFVLLCIGVLLAGWTFLAVAEDVHVRAKVSAPQPTGAATIFAPNDSQHFTAVPVTVSGTCPADGSGAYIKLYRNDFFSGVAICDASQNFSLSSDLFPGANKLKAVIFNKTDDAGPDSNTPTVYYDVPEEVAQRINSNQPPFIITADFKYTGFYVGQSIAWKLSINGGTPPYALNINWGDGKNTVISRSGAGDFSVEHSYDKPGGYKGSYKVSLSASDAVGRQTSLDLFALVNPADAGPVGGTTVKPPPLAQTKGWLMVIWPAYFVVLLMSASYLLGEREEFLGLKKRGSLRPRRG
jgi:hypothetical protein